MVVSNPQMSLAPEQEYIEQTSQNHRKKFAQFFTPVEIADFMVSWILGCKSINTVLDPAFGLGVFARSILKQIPNALIKGFELDPTIYTKALTYFQNQPNVTLYNEDYMYNDWNSVYDAIICNPPYLKFHDYNNKKVVNEVEFQTGIRFKSTSNLYTMFLAKSIAQLAENGRACYIVPTEFLNSDYGVSIKKYLLETNVLRYLFVIDFNSMAFEKTLTTTTILLLAKDGVEKNIQMRSVSNARDLLLYTDTINNNTVLSDLISYRNKDLNPNIKWTQYYHPPVSEKTIRLIPFSYYGRIKRGIATGDNDYFTFNLSKAKEFDIPQESLLPCITKSADVPSKVFTELDYQILLNNDKKVLLLNANVSSNQAVKRYLDNGVEKGVNLKYLTSKRTPWYALENRIPSELWVSVFNRNEPKFIVNAAHIHNLTTFHCVYLNKMNEFDMNLFVSYLLSDVSKSILEKNRREYGNGLKKFEPNDINYSMVLDLRSMNVRSKEMVVRLFKEYLSSVREQNPQETILSDINSLFCDEYSIE